MQDKALAAPPPPNAKTRGRENGLQRAMTKDEDVERPPTIRSKIIIHNAANGDWSVGVVKAVRKGEIVVREIVSWDVS